MAAKIQVTRLPIKIRSSVRVSTWTNFAKSGDPNSSGNSPWPKLAADANGKYFVQDIPLSMATASQFRSDYKCDFWDATFTSRDRVLAWI